MILRLSDRYINTDLIKFYIRGTGDNNVPLGAIGYQYMGDNPGILQVSTGEDAAKVRTFLEQEAIDIVLDAADQLAFTGMTHGRTPRLGHTNRKDLRK